jgi:hypothetical protein
MKDKDLNKIAKIEKAMIKKFGKETIANPNSYWTDEKEKEYLNQSKEFYNKKRKLIESLEKIEEDGFLVSKSLITRENKRNCSICETFSFELKDDLYMNKFECCFKCFVQWVDGREERWLKGWRPNEN